MGSKKQSQAAARVACGGPRTSRPRLPGLRGRAFGPHQAFRFLTRAHVSHSIQLTGALVYFGRITSRVSFRRFTIDQSNSLFQHLTSSSLVYVCGGSGQRKAWWVGNTSISFTPSDWAVMHCPQFRLDNNVCQSRFFNH